MTYREKKGNLEDGPKKRRLGPEKTKPVPRMDLSRPEGRGRGAEGNTWLDEQEKHAITKMEIMTLVLGKGDQGAIMKASNRKANAKNIGPFWTRITAPVWGVRRGWIIMRSPTRAPHLPRKLLGATLPHGGKTKNFTREI